MMALTLAGSTHEAPVNESSDAKHPGDTHAATGRGVPDLGTGRESDGEGILGTRDGAIAWLEGEGFASEGDTPDRWLGGRGEMTAELRGGDALTSVRLSAGGTDEASGAFIVEWLQRFGGDGVDAVLATLQAADTADQDKVIIPSDRTIHVQSVRFGSPSVVSPPEA